MEDLFTFSQNYFFAGISIKKDETRETGIDGVKPRHLARKAEATRIDR
jgi:hypothetical protein